MPTELLEKYSGAIDTEDLMARCLGSVDFVNRILGVLVDQCSTEIDGLERAAMVADVEQVGRISHRLKGTLANASAKQMSSLADAICHASKQGDLEEVQVQIRQLRASWDEFSIAVDDGVLV